MTTKKCRKCKNEKPVELFSKGGKASRDGLAGWCKTCMKEYCASHYRKNKSKFLKRARAYSLRVYFNISVDEYEDMYRRQNGTCAICRVPNLVGKRLAVDHCHKTGIVRGLLCYRCNVGLGYFRDNPEMLVRAINYIEQAGKEEVK